MYGNVQLPTVPFRLGSSSRNCPRWPWTMFLMGRLHHSGDCGDSWQWWMKPKCRLLGINERGSIYLWTQMSLNGRTMPKNAILRFKNNIVSTKPELKREKLRKRCKNYTLATNKNLTLISSSMSSNSFCSSLVRVIFLICLACSLALIMASMAGERPWRPFRILTSALLSFDSGLTSWVSAVWGAATGVGSVVGVKLAARCWRTFSSLGLKRVSSLWK